MMPTMRRPSIRGTPFAAPGCGVIGHRAAGGFTLLELLVVMTIIAVLSALGLPLYYSVRHNIDRTATTVLIQSVVSAMEQYQVRTGSAHYHWVAISKTTPTGAIIGYTDMVASNDPHAAPGQTIGSGWIWMLSGCTTGSAHAHMIDGFPSAAAPVGDGGSPAALAASAETGFTTDLIASHYLGFYDMVHPDIDHRFVAPDHQIIDAWGSPLRIAYADATYGSDQFGIWSPGLDRLDSTADDLWSWSSK
jgi:prepilin-type N-terminal cleavage/methylation domain-containing protein